MEGRVFSERTKTVVLSRDGAGIISSYKLSPEQELVLRSEESRKEIEARVVGQIGSDGGTHIYGIAFLDRGTNFWGIDFPDLSETEKRASQTLLECSSCHARETADHSDLAGDVMAINESIVRYCQKCGSSTLWKQPVSGSLPESGPQPPKITPAERIAPSGAGFGEDTLNLSVRTEPPLAPGSWRESKRPSAAAQPPSAFAGAAWTKPENTAPTLDPVTPAAAPDRKTEVAPASNPVDGPKAKSPAAAVPDARAAAVLKEQENRRKHGRTRVALKACVRRPGSPDDVVACEDISRGGLRFRSARKYSEKTVIDVAVPYSPGDQAIFVSAQVAYVQELPEQKMYRCGVTYLRSGK